jgi:hypothetical protein
VHIARVVVLPPVVYRALVSPVLLRWPCRLVCGAVRRAHLYTVIHEAWRDATVSVTGSEEAEIKHDCPGCDRDRDSLMLRVTILEHLRLLMHHLGNGLSLESGSPTRSMSLLWQGTRLDAIDEGRIQGFANSLRNL